MHKQNVSLAVPRRLCSMHSRTKRKSDVRFTAPAVCRGPCMMTGVQHGCNAKSAALHVTSSLCHTRCRPARDELQQPAALHASAGAGENCGRLCPRARGIDRQHACLHHQMLCTVLCRPAVIMHLNFQNGRRQWKPTQSEILLGSPFLYNLTIAPIPLSCVTPPGHSAARKVAGHKTAACWAPLKQYQATFRHPARLADDSCVASRAAGASQGIVDAVRQLGKRLQALLLQL